MVSWKVKPYTGQNNKEEDKTYVICSNSRTNIEVKKKSTKAHEKDPLKKTQRFTKQFLIF